MKKHDSEECIFSSAAEISGILLSFVGAAIWLCAVHLEILRGVFDPIGMFRFVLFRMAAIMPLALFLRYYGHVHGARSDISFSYLLWLNALLFFPCVRERIPSLAPMLRVLLPWTALALLLFENLVEPHRTQIGKIIESGHPGLTLFVFLAIFYCVWGLRIYNDKGIRGGDEIHYAMQAKSLAEDGDLDLVNNIRDSGADFVIGDFDYYKRDHISAISRQGKAYSFHPVGIALLMAPVMRLAGFRGCIIFIALVSALMGPLLFAVLKKYCSDIAVRFVTVLCFTVPLPFCIYSVRPYPEFFTALCVMYAFWVLTRGGSSCVAYAAAGALLGYSMWLLPRRCILQLLGLSIAAAAVFHRDRSLKNAVCFFVPFLIVIAGYSVFTQYMFSGPNISTAANYETIFAGASVNFNIFLNFNLKRFLPLLAILFDAFGGAIWINPFLVFLIPASVMIIRRENFRALILPIFLFWSQYLLIGLGSNRICGWQAGRCHPCRYILPVLFYMAIPAVLIYERYKRAAVSGRRSGIMRILPGGAAVLIIFSLISLCAMIRFPHRFDLPVEAFCDGIPAMNNLFATFPKFRSSQCTTPSNLSYTLVAACVGIGLSYLFFVSKKCVRMRARTAFLACVSAMAILDLFLGAIAV